MELNFLFWFFLVGLIIATLQDIKRREVDNWLNLFLLTGGLTFLFYKILFSQDYDFIFLIGFMLAIMFAIMNLFYYGRIFGGGDAVLLFAMTPFLISLNFFQSILNIGIFILLMMLSGSVYGILFSIFLYTKNSQKANREIIKKFKETKTFSIISISLGIISLALIYFSSVFIVFSAILIFLPLVYIFAKSLEEVSLVKTISGKELREGDWLAQRIYVKNKSIKPNWEGVSTEEIALLKNEKQIKIKEGLPFVPAFLIAFFLYLFLRNWFLGFF